METTSPILATLLVAVIVHRSFGARVGGRAVMLTLAVGGVFLAIGIVDGDETVVLACTVPS